MLKVTVDSYIHAEDCPFRNVLDKVGDKWSFLIFAVLEDGPKRFNEIKRLVGDISHRVLTTKLRGSGAGRVRVAHRLSRQSTEGRVRADQAWAIGSGSPRR